MKTITYHVIAGPVTKTETTWARFSDLKDSLEYLCSGYLSGNIEFVNSSYLMAEVEKHPIIQITESDIQLNATDAYYENEDLVTEYYGKIMKEWFRRKKEKESE